MTDDSNSDLPPKVVIVSITLQLIGLVSGLAHLGLFSEVPLPIMRLVMLLAVGIAVFFCWMLYRGRNWARYILAAITVAGVCGGVVDLFETVQPVNQWQLCLWLFNTTISVLAAALLFFPPANRWFKSIKPGTRKASA